MFLLNINHLRLDTNQMNDKWWINFFTFLRIESNEIIQWGLTKSNKFKYLKLFLNIFNIQSLQYPSLDDLQFYHLNISHERKYYDWKNSHEEKNNR